jgi:hypothetical protein
MRGSRRDPTTRILEIQNNAIGFWVVGQFEFALKRHDFVPQIPEIEIRALIPAGCLFSN